MVDKHSEEYKTGFLDAVTMAHDVCGPFIREAKTIEAAEAAASIATLIFSLVEMKPDG